MNRIIAFYIVTILCTSTLFSQLNPADAYPELFKAVQENQIFQDQKTFVDCTPLFPVDRILKQYDSQKKATDFDLKHFVSSHFQTNLTDTSAIFKHLDLLWDNLTREPKAQDSLSSLIALPYPYIVPGGRFREVYYWDSYFTMLGLQEAGRIETMQNMVDNFAFLIDTHGHIPNGNRTYYLSRSQPPFFSLMVGLLAENLGDSMYTKYQTPLEKEYNFWMHGESSLSKKNKDTEHVVWLEKDVILNRYWDQLNTPRPESFMQDVETHQESKRDSLIFRDLRSGAESGWDYSSRWFADSSSIHTIKTTEIIPIDLNCLLYNLEKTLAKCAKFANDTKQENFYLSKAENRKSAILNYLWDAEKGYFYDYNFVQQKQTTTASLAGIYPLFFNLVNQEQANAVIEIMKKNYLKDGGLVTSLYATGEQWDYPNGWAPLQWMGYKACKNYGYHALAKEIVIKWTDLNLKVFFDTGKMLEKYNVINTNLKGGGGEYELQDGFGWTNGVFLKLWNLERK